MYYLQYLLLIQEILLGLSLYLQILNFLFGSILLEKLIFLNFYNSQMYYFQ